MLGDIIYNMAMTKRYIIAPYAMHKSLLKAFRAHDSFIDVKLIDKNNLVSSFYEEVDSRAIKEIMIGEKVLDDVALEIFNFLPFINENISNSKVRYLMQVKSKIASLGLLKKDPYYAQLIEGKAVEIYGYSPLDNELITILNALGCQFVFHQETQVKKGCELVTYSSVFDEVLACLNEVAELLDKGVGYDDIYIYCADKNYFYYLDRFQQDFGFRINIPQRRTFFSQNFTSEILKEYHLNRDFGKVTDFINQLDISQDNKNSLFQIIDEVRDERFAFEEQYQYLVSVCKKRYLNEDIYSPAINLITEPIKIENAHIFVLGFHEGLFPISYQDNDYLTDDIKSELGLTTSLEKGKISSDTLHLFFAQNNEFRFSFGERFSNNYFYPSPFAKLWNMEVRRGVLPKIYYSKIYAELALAAQKDLDKYFHEKSDDFFALNSVVSIPYDSYDNEFTGAKVFNLEKRLKHSYSRMKVYHACPFQYFASVALKLDPFENSFHLCLGNIAHHIFQDIQEDGFDFESSYRRAYQIENQSYPFSIAEQVLLNQLKKDIKVAVEAIGLHQSKMSHPRFYMEENLSFDLDNQTVVEGKIDKIVITDDRYMFLLDYKTGKESFSPSLVQFGSSFQLPTYALLVSQSEKFNHYELAGLFIHHVIPDSIKRQMKEDALVPTYLKLDGYVVDDIMAVKSIDTTFGEPGSESSFIKSLRLKKDGTFDAKSRKQSKEYFRSLADEARCLFIDGNKKIRENQFPVRPQFLDKEGPCKYCSFRDICYVKNEQKVYPKAELEQEEGSGNGI